MKKIFIILLFLAIAGFELPALAANSKIEDTISLLESSNKGFQLPNISTQCQNALGALIGELQTCFPFESLLIIAPLLNPNTSVLLVPGILTNFSDSFCAGVKSNTTTNTTAPFCNSTVVNTAKTIILKGCQDDINKGNVLIVGILTIITMYPPLTTVLCAPNPDKTTKYCYTEDLSFGFLPKPGFTEFGVPIDNIVFSDPKLFCTNCTRTIINPVLDFVFDTKHNPDVIPLLTKVLTTLKVPVPLEQIKDVVLIKCGFNFSDKQGNFTS